MLFRSQAEIYLSALRETDAAVEKLITYFQHYDEKVVIVMYGDHLPHIPEFLSALYGKDTAYLTLEETSRMYQTPFFIWANYDIKEEEIKNISLNYLNSLVMDAAKLPKTGYQAFLSELRRTLPVISSWGYQDFQGNQFPQYSSSAYDEQLDAYRILQYNNMFDTRVKEFFTP